VSFYFLNLIIYYCFVADWRINTLQYNTITTTGMKGNFSWWRSGFACSALLADVFCRTGREEEKRRRQKKKEEEG